VAIISVGYHYYFWYYHKTLFSIFGYYIYYSTVQSLYQCNQIYNDRFVLYNCVYGTKYRSYVHIIIFLFGMVCCTIFLFTFFGALETAICVLTAHYIFGVWLYASMVHHHLHMVLFIIC